MGVRQFDAIAEVTVSSTKRTTGPESWEGYESDPFWQQAHGRTG